MRGIKWPEVASFIDSYMERKYGRLLQQFFQGTINQVQQTGTGYTATLIRTGASTPDGNTYAVAPNYVPATGDVVDCIWRDNHTGYVLWPTLTSAAHPGLSAVQITEVVLTATTASVAFRGIPQQYRHLLLVANCRGDTAAANTDLKAQFNGDTGTNYHWQALVMNQSNAPTVAGLASQTSVEAGYLPAANAALANEFGGSTFWIYDYANVSRLKSTFFWGSQMDATTQATRLGGGLWNSSAAISSIVLFPNAGNFVSDSKFMLYGMP